MRGGTRVEIPVFASNRIHNDWSRFFQVETWRHSVLSLETKRGKESQLVMHRFTRQNARWWLHDQVTCINSLNSSTSTAKTSAGYMITCTVKFPKRGQKREPLHIFHNEFTCKPAKNLISRWWAKEFMGFHPWLMQVASERRCGMELLLFCQQSYPRPQIRHICWPGQTFDQPRDIFCTTSKIVASCFIHYAGTASEHWHMLWVSYSVWPSNFTTGEDWKNHAMRSFS